MDLDEQLNKYYERRARITGQKFRRPGAKSPKRSRANDEKLKVDAKSAVPRHV